MATAPDSTAVGAPAAQVSPIELDARDAAAPWGPPLVQAAERAWNEAHVRLGLEPPAPVRLTTFGSDYALERYLGSRPTHVVALARGDGKRRPAEIILLRPEWFRLPTGEQAKVLIHEMTHLVVNARFQGEIPVWLNEGLAMLTSGEAGMQDRLRLVVAGTLGGVLPLAQIESTLLVGGEAQGLAYAQSISLTRFLLARDFKDAPEGPTPRALARVLADPQAAPGLLGRLWDPNFRRALDLQWRASQRTLWNWLGVFSGGGFLWGVATVLFLLAVWRKRRYARQIRERMGREEAFAAEYGGSENLADPQPWEQELPEEPDWAAQSDDADEDDEDPRAGRGR